jgi:predicted PilT family ATPase
MDPVKHQLQMSASNQETVSVHLKHGLALARRRGRPGRLRALFFEKFG